MSAQLYPTPDPNLDLVLERIIDVPRELVWAAWTQPKHLVHWFTPHPWKTIDCEIDLRPGGIFRSTMQSPEGENFPNLGCILEVIEHQKFSWTDALQPGFRPSPDPAHPFGFFTAILTLEPHGNGGTKYRATAIHGNVVNRKKHEEMGFHEGWGTVLNQLVEYIKKTKF
ncbi:polyketide cyclase [Leptospira yasudae]|uniref:SRPBCC family protein n=1 Tax=Leptospira yasudae TaxID=2202201 RepID=UPI000E59DA21|nr:SRPBCC family protein [Leptospira yasudae]RHX91046.1 polyketide cyclase [Leptospira yasudae]TGK26255.1 polyketide cyclase [Leptospira yasudae]TGM08500.1 polyketide cyclase [Leptospira yasudae]